jgi:hypothetical protein
VELVLSHCNHVGSNFGLHHCWATCCHSILWSEWAKTIQDSQKNVRTMRRKLQHAKEIVPMCGKGYRVAELASLMTARHVRPLHEWQTVLKELILWFKTTDGLLSRTQPIGLTWAVDLHIPPSTRTSDITWAHVATSKQFLQRYREGNAFLQHVLTSDETWVHLYECARKLQSTEWKHMPSNGEVMLTMFGDFNGPSSRIIRIVDRRLTVHGTVLCLKRRWNPLFAVNAEDRWQM